MKEEARKWKEGRREDEEWYLQDMGKKIKVSQWHREVFGSFPNLKKKAQPSIPPLPRLFHLNAGGSAGQLCASLVLEVAAKIYERTLTQPRLTPPPYLTPLTLSTCLYTSPFRYYCSAGFLILWTDLFKSHY